MVIRTFAVLVALGIPATAVAQTDSTPADSALARAAGPGSRAVVERRALRTFFADDPRHLLTLVPGVVLRGSETGLASAGWLSLRGGEPGGSAVYIDGAPVRFLIGDGQGLSLGLASIDHIAVTTGPPDLALPDLRSGVIEFAARAGGDTFAGAFSGLTDEALTGLGFNRFEGGVGGPLPVPGATWFVGGTLTGQRSHFVGLGSGDVPGYVPAGIDTLVTRTVAGQSETVPFPRFIDQRAYDWGTELRGHAKVQFDAASGTRVSVTGIANQTQERFFPGAFALAPSLYTGARAGARLVVANWHQPLGALRGGPLTLRVNASLASNEQLSGLLAPESELASAHPSLGITLASLQFTGAEAIPFPLTEQMVRNIRVNSGLRVPYLNRDDLRNVQNSRANPYGMERSWIEAGLDGPLTLTFERRTDVRWAVDWAADAGHVITLGGGLAGAELSHYSATLLGQAFMDLYRADPNRAGVYVTDRLVRGNLRADVALRFDHFGSVGLFPRVPGWIYSHPAFDRSAAINTDTGYTNSVARVMEPGRAHSAVSFRTAAELGLGSRTTVRGAVGVWVEPPPLGLVLKGSNSDLAFTSVSDAFGRDVEYGHASLAEAGVRLAVRDGLTADVAIYRRSRPGYAFRSMPFDNPANPGDTVNVNVLAIGDDRVVVGADLALDWRMGAWLGSRIAYGLQSSDPGATVGPAGPIGGETITTQALTVAAVARVPDRLLGGLDVSVLLRLTSGLPYTRLDPAGATGALAVDQNPLFLGSAVEPLYASQLPWTRTLDLRLAKAVDLGGPGLTLFADFRNLLNVHNVINLFAETGDVVNLNHRNQSLEVEFQNIEFEALNNNRLLANGDINLQPSCDSWTVTSGANGAVVNCVALRRAEARFGNGDGLFSLAERETTLYAFYNAFHGPHTFYGAGRSARLGIELRW